MALDTSAGQVAGSGREHRVPLSIGEARRRVTVSVAVAVMAAIVLGLWLLQQYQDPPVSLPGYVFALLVPLVAATAQAAFALIAELLWPRPRSATRRARLHHRRISDMVDRRLLIAHWSSVALFAMVALAGALLSTDGRTLGLGENERSGEFLGVVTNTEFPGADVTTPLALALAVLLALNWSAVLAGLHRPDVVSASRVQDLALRLRSNGATLRVTTAAIMITNGALVTLAGAAVATAFRGGWIADVGTACAYLGLGLAASALLFAFPWPFGRTSTNGSGHDR